MFQTADASASSLDAHIEDQGIVVTFITLSCADSCADIEAIATGGNPPYTYAWSDGTTGGTRRVCPSQTTTYQVTVTDSPRTGELAQPSHTGTASLDAAVFPCLEAGTPAASDASTGDASTLCVGSGADVIDSGTGLPQVLTIDVKGSTRYFNGGAALPAGNYRVTYVDGCMEYGAESFGYSWCVADPQVMLGQGATALTDPGHCVLVGNGATIIGELPGATAMGTTTYAACVAASKTSAPLDVSFAGGTLGIYVNDSLTSDDVGGESQCGASPTWQLSAH
jgi:hypothetical protein